MATQSGEARAATVNCDSKALHQTAIERATSIYQEVDIKGVRESFFLQGGSFIEILYGTKWYSESEFIPIFHRLKLEKHEKLLVSRAPTRLGRSVNSTKDLSNEDCKILEYSQEKYDEVMGSKG